MVRIALGPLTAAQFLDFLPDSEAFATLAGITRWFLGQGLSFDVQPALAAGEEPSWMRLSEDATTAPRLGWTTWLSDEPFLVPAFDAVFAEDECSGGVGLCH